LEAATKLKNTISPAIGIRQGLLDATAETEGRSWAALLSTELLGEGRLARGGWPGTVGEARGRVGSSIGAILRERRMLALSHDELVRASHVAYEAARVAWLRLARATPRSADEDENEDDD